MIARVSLLGIQDPFMFFLCKPRRSSCSGFIQAVVLALSVTAVLFFLRPSCVLDEDLLQINLWLGAGETTTNMHFDANHNLLFVLKGSKRVALVPPSMTSRVQAMPVRNERVHVKCCVNESVGKTVTLG